MLHQEGQSAYLSAAASGATQIGLHVVVYSTLAGDLLRAGEACRKRDIATRCSASNRAISILGHLEAWANTLDDLQLTGSLKLFYQGLRQDIVRLQGNGTSAEFARLSDTVQAVREAWQAKEQSAMRTDPPSVQTRLEARTGTPRPGEARASLAWSA